MALDYLPEKARSCSVLHNTVIISHEFGPVNKKFWQIAQFLQTYFYEYITKHMAPCRNRPATALHILHCDTQACRAAVCVSVGAWFFAPLYLFSLRKKAVNRTDGAVCSVTAQKTAPQQTNLIKIASCNRTTQS